MKNLNQTNPGRRQRPINLTAVSGQPAEAPVINAAVLEEILQAAGLEALD